MSTIPIFKPSEMAQGALMLEGNPFSMKLHPYLPQIYDLNTHEMLLMMARQTGKSTSLSGKQIISSISTPHHYTLYIAPTFKQVSVFSNDKLKAMKKYSPVVKKYFTDSSCQEGVLDKEFSNGSKIHLRSCYLKADTVRGITADDLYFDEVQDILHDNILVISESASARANPKIVYAGTPKTMNNTLGRLWKRSDQREWVIKCTGCNKHNIVMLENIGKEGLICSKCGKKLDYLTGAWYKTNHTKNFDHLIPAFRLPQPCSPFHQDDKKWKLLLNKLEGGNMVYFFNEVLSLPYEMSDKPITEEEVEACCDASRTDWDIDISKSSLKGYPMYAGLDYGRGTRSFTVLTIICRIGGVSRVVFAKKYVGFESDPTAYIQDIIYQCGKYNVLAIGADSGDGTMQNSTLKLNIGIDKVFPYFCSDNLKELVRYNPKNGEYSFNRTRSLQERFFQIKNKRVSFPNWKLFKPFSDMITCVYIDYDSNDQRIYYDHDGENEPDDFLHSWNFAEMTADRFRPWTGEDGLYDNNY